MVQAPDAYAQRLLAERARREAARKAAASAPQRKPQIGMPPNLGQMVSRQPAPDRVGQVRQAITQGVDYAGNFLAQGRAPEIGGAVRSMVEPVAQFPVTAVTDPLRAANQAQQALDPAYAMARGLTTTRLGAQEGNLGDVAAGVTEMGLAGLSFVPGGAAVKGARSMPPAPVRRPPPIGQPNVLAPQASRGPILNQLADQPELLGGGLGGALGATQGETPEERARNALLGAAGGAVGGRMARGMTPDRTRMGSNLGNVLAPSSPQGPKPNRMGFYSQLEATVTRPNTPGKATGEAWAAWLKSQPGVKAEELEATGVTDWLRAKEGQVSRADVENYVRNNGVQVEEITKKANGQSDLNVEKVARQLFDESWETSAWDDWMYEARQERLQKLFDAQPQAKREEWLDLGFGDELEDWAAETFGRRWDDRDIFSPEEIRNFQDEAWEQTRYDYENMAEQRIEEMQSEGAGDTKWWTHTLPGGKNYTELMLTLPTRPSRVPQSMNELTPNQKRDFIQFNDRNAEVQDIPDSELDAVIRDMDLGPANFKDFTQRGMKILPEEAYRSSHWDEPNVLAHVRFKERTGPNGQRILALEEVQSDWHQAGRQRGYQGGGGTVPDAPFKDNKWAALAMKRVVKYAADNGFDGVAWIPGNIQNGAFHNATDKRADFYDKIFVNIANDIGKKSGAKAQRLTLDTAPSGYVQATDFHYLPLTPELRKKAVEQGFPLFSVGAVGAGAAMTSQNKAEAQVNNPRRPDGTLKGKGWLGELPVTFPNGSTGVATEYSMQSDAVKVDGRNIDFPTLVPSLTPDEVKLMITDIIPNRKPIPEAIVQKAIAHARAQLAKGQSVFVENGPPDQKKPPGQRPRG